MYVCMHSLIHRAESQSHRVLFSFKKYELQWDGEKNTIKSQDMFFQSWIWINFTWLSKHAALLCEMRVQRNRCPSRKCIKYAFCVNGLVSVWCKQDILCIDVLFFCNIFNEQRSSTASTGYNWIGSIFFYNEPILTSSSHHVRHFRLPP